ncbi:hypothetical protein [Bathymodiolus platifrons methanotrophic gill symbiont]|nr:hypothetical protein [Bathymodiolus platifrons methanotrophic gill symbiont]
MLKIYSGIAAKIVPAQLKHLCWTAGSRYFCESLFWASQPKQAAKT